MSYMNMYIFNRATVETFYLKGNFKKRIVLKNKNAFVNFLTKVVKTIWFLLNFIQLSVDKCLSRPRVKEKTTTSKLGWYKG